MNTSLLGQTGMLGRTGMRSGRAVRRDFDLSAFFFARRDGMAGDDARDAIPSFA